MRIKYCGFLTRCLCFLDCSDDASLDQQLITWRKGERKAVSFHILKTQIVLSFKMRFICTALRSPFTHFILSHRLAGAGEGGD